MFCLWLGKQSKAIQNEYFPNEMHPNQWDNKVTASLPATMLPCCVCLWGGDKEMEGEINHLLQHKAQVISWKWTHTGVWYMGSPLPCNGNLSVLYDFIQNPSSLCGATKHIKTKWRMVPGSVRKVDEGNNMYSPPASVGDGRVSY